jgi:hypothetical protein
VIDYIANHRSFRLKPRTLFQLKRSDVRILRALNMLDSGNAVQYSTRTCTDQKGDWSALSGSRVRPRR